MLQVRIQKESSHDSDEDDEIEIEETVDDVNVLCPLTQSHTLSNKTDVVPNRTSEALANENRIPLTEFQSDHSNRMDIRSFSADKTSQTKVKATEERMCREDIDISEPQSENTQSLAVGCKEKDFKANLKQGTNEFPCPKDCSEGRESGKGNSYSLGSSHQDILESIFNLPPPTEDLILDPKTISEEEKVIHAEFFEGRSAKTPKRYLKVSVYICVLTLLCTTFSLKHYVH